MGLAWLIARSGPRVLQLGPLYIGHTRRWAQHARALGCTVLVAGHEKPGRRTLAFDDVVVHDPTQPAEEWLRDVLDRFEPDIVQAHYLPRWCRIAADVADCPVIATAWGSDVYLTDETAEGADAVLVNSEHMRRTLIDRGASPERLHLVDLGVDLERFRPARHRPGNPVILSPRAPTPLYNLDVVLVGFELLRERVPGARLVLAHGDLPLPDEFRLPAGARAVRDVPHEDMPELLQAAAAVVSIPSSDGSPNSVWEALASGVPVVASDLPQLRERLGDDIVRFIAPTPDALAAALHDLVTQPAVHARAAAAGRAWARENVDARRELRRLAAVYEEVRAGRTATAAAPPLRPS
jgi:glycosyltransferase involved in cell wall biosynthesis